MLVITSLKQIFQGQGVQFAQLTYIYNVIFRRNCSSPRNDRNMKSRTNHYFIMFQYVSSECMTCHVAKALWYSINGQYTSKNHIWSCFGFTVTAKPPIPLPLLRYSECTHAHAIPSHYIFFTSHHPPQAVTRHCMNYFAHQWQYHSPGRISLVALVVLGVILHIRHCLVIEVFEEHFLTFELREYIHQYTTCPALVERMIQLGHTSPSSQRLQRLLAGDCHGTKECWIIPRDLQTHCFSGWLKW